MNEQSTFCVYILRSNSGRFYIGSTEDVVRRIGEHNDPENRSTYTSKNGPWPLVWSEFHPD